MRRIFAAPLLLIASASQAQPGHQETSIPLDSGLVLHVVVVPFDSTAHTVGRYEKAGVRTIDGRPFFGSDGELPWSALTSAELEVDGARIPLDVSGMFNPWYDAPYAEHFQSDSYGIEGGWLIRGLFSDGAGAYVTEWLVLDGGSMRTVLTNDDRVIQVLFGEGPE